jgi:hypothetical protein
MAHASLLDRGGAIDPGLALRHAGRDVRAGYGQAGLRMTSLEIGMAGTPTRVPVTAHCNLRSMAEPSVGTASHAATTSRGAAATQLLVFRCR